MIVINGKRISGHEIIGKSNITISNGKILVNGKDITKEVEDKDEPLINIHITGDVKQLKVDTCNTVTVEGVTENIKTQSGDVKAKDVGGSISTMSGDVEAENVEGNLSTMSGNIRSRR